MFKKIAIVGVGLIGGSVGLAARKKRLAKEIVGVCRREVSRRKAVKYGTVDRATLNLDEGLRGADLVVVATPVGKIAGKVKDIINRAENKMIVTDAGSTKETIVKSVEKLNSRYTEFVGSHPMAGSEKGGPENACGRLFENRDCFVTATKNTNKRALNKVKKFWRTLGARPIVISPEEHDKITAKISQMVHVVASGLVIANKDALKYAASGFRDTTRIALADSDLWKDICVSNSNNIADALDELIGILEKFRSNIKRKKVKRMQVALEEARKLRSGLNRN